MTRITQTRETERIQTIIIGGGQAGLSVGYHLSRRNLPFVILDTNDRIGDSWRARWDSLRLFTPACLDSLDGMPFPAPPFSFPTKDEMADYLRTYAEHFRLPVRNSVRVDGLTRDGNRYVIAAGDRTFEAEHVVVAMANYQQPRVPAFASALSPSIVQMHSVAYRRPSQLQPGGVLLVGAGNSGSEIAMELSRSGHRVLMSGRDTGHVPFRIDGFAARHGLTRFLLRFVFHRVLTTNTPLGRKARPHILTHGGPLIRVKPRDLAAAGVERVGKTLGVCDGKPMLEDGRILDVTNVIWSTGFAPSCAWIDLPIFGADGEPRQERGCVSGEPGLYFVGRQFLYAMSSTMIHGVGRDADFVAQTIAMRIAKSASQVRGIWPLSRPRSLTA
jgi:putative flavoprotein involved in K+ transport